MPYLATKKFTNLSKVYILTFCLSHGQSSVEHRFSSNKEYINFGSQSDSLHPIEQRTSSYDQQQQHQPFANLNFNNIFYNRPISFNPHNLSTNKLVNLTNDIIFDKVSPDSDDRLSRLQTIDFLSHQRNSTFFPR